MLEEALMQILSRQDLQPPRIKEQSRNGRRYVSRVILIYMCHSLKNSAKPQCLANRRILDIFALGYMIMMLKS